MIPKHQEIPGVAYTGQIIVLWHMLNNLIIVKVCLSLYRYEFINAPKGLVLTFVTK